MKRRILSGILVAAMATTMIATTAFAATDDGTTNVTYNNTNQVTDPGVDDPTDAEWAVEIPSNIVFTDDVTEADATVRLVPVNGAEDVSTVSGVTVTVSSAKDYTLQLSDGSDPVAYTLTYNDTVMSSVETSVGTLDGTTDTTEIAGVAKLTGTATKVGEHTDVLTYTVNDGE